MILLALVCDTKAPIVTRASEPRAAGIGPHLVVVLFYFLAVHVLGSATLMQSFQRTAVFSISEQN
jgi:hypothetical protein